MIKNLVFDLGDTLISYQYKDIDKILGIKNAFEIQKEFFRSSDYLCFMCDNRTEAELLNTYPNNFEERKVIESVLTDLQWVVYYPKLYEWINELKSKGFRIYVLSNYHKDMFDRHIKPIPISFDGILISEDVGTNKPSRNIYEVLLERYGLNPAETMFFDDRIENLEEPRNMGFLTLSLQLDKQSGVKGIDYISN